MINQDKYFGRGYRTHVLNEQKKVRDKRQAKIVWLLIVLFTISIWSFLIYAAL